MIATEDYVSRFIQENDLKSDHMIYPLPAAWWSRPYEYAWAAKFATPHDVVLDVACGICHPFKFDLGLRAAVAFGCDMDTRILSRQAILEDITQSIGSQASEQFDESLFDKVQLTQCNMTNLPYPDRMFDKVYCISVLEHVDEDTQRAALLAFARVMKNDGLLVMTVDHPAVNLDQLQVLMRDTGLEFAGAYDFTPPDNAISSTMWGPELKCIRLALRKTKSGVS